jgi:hypothetical protein
VLLELELVCPSAPGGLHTLRAPTEAERDSWFDALRAALEEV